RRSHRICLISRTCVGIPHALPQGMRTALAAAAVLFAAQSARAEPFSTGKAATISAALTTTGVTAGAVLFFGAAQRGRRAGMVAGLAIGGGSLIFAPSFSRLA